MRDTGDFKVTAGNTAWLLHDVYSPPRIRTPARRTGNPEADRPHSTARPGWAEQPPGGDGHRHRPANASGEALTNQHRAATTV